MTRPAVAKREQAISRDMVVKTAVQLVEEHDVASLTMRRLATELGTAVTAVYWHVGNRDALLDLMVDQLLIDMQQVRISGKTPRARITSLCRRWRQRLWEHQHLIALADERGKTATMFQPILAALANELGGLGLTGRAAAGPIRALQLHVISSVVMHRTAERRASTGATDPAVWPNSADDAELIAALAQPIDYQAVFDDGLEALLDRTLGCEPVVGRVIRP